MASMVAHLTPDRVRSPVPVHGLTEGSGDGEDRRRADRRSRVDSGYA